jgi:hypothetical protein
VTSITISQRHVIVTSLHLHVSVSSSLLLELPFTRGFKRSTESDSFGNLLRYIYARLSFCNTVELCAGIFFRGTMLKTDLARQALAALASSQPHGWIMRTGLRSFPLLTRNVSQLPATPSTPSTREDTSFSSSGESPSGELDDDLDRYRMCEGCI